jgi:hypothetical protein
MMFNATFNNISVISRWSALLVEESRRKPLTRRKSLTNFITLCCIEYTSPESKNSKMLYLYPWFLRLSNKLPNAIPDTPKIKTKLCAV